MTGATPGGSSGQPGPGTPSGVAPSATAALQQQQEAERLANLERERQREEAFRKSVEEAAARVKAQEEAALRAEQERLAAERAQAEAAERQRQEAAAAEAERQRQEAAAAANWRPTGPTGDLPNLGGLGARDKAEFDRFGDTLNLEDLNNPNLSNADRYYLAGLAYNQSPSADTAKNFLNWKLAMDPETIGAREEVRNLLSDPSKITGPAAEAIFQKAIDEIGVDNIAEALGDAGGEQLAAILGSDLPVASIIASLASGASAGETAANAAKAYAIAQLASVPGVGLPLAGVVVVDSVLSRILGYDSPISDVVAGVGKNIDKALSWAGDQVFEPIGSAARRAFTIPRSIRKRFGFQEGGLVDLGDDSMYNDYNFYGGLSALPQAMMPIEPVPPVLGFAGGGVIPLVGGGKVAMGPGGGLDDLIPTSINGRQAAALSDGEFVVPADVVSMMGDGSSNAGARRLYDLVKQIRQAKTGTDRQAGPLPTGKILERVMK